MKLYVYRQWYVQNIINASPEYQQRSRMHGIEKQSQVRLLFFMMHKCNEYYVLLGNVRKSVQCDRISSSLPALIFHLIL